MRKVVVSEFITLDGVMEDPGGAEKFERGGWAFQFERGPEEINSNLMSSFRQMPCPWAGRRTRDLHKPGLVERENLQTK